MTTATGSPTPAVPQHKADCGSCCCCSVDTDRLRQELAETQEQLDNAMAALDALPRSTGEFSDVIAPLAALGRASGVGSQRRREAEDVAYRAYVLGKRQASDGWDEAQNEAKRLEAERDEARVIAGQRISERDQALAARGAATEERNRLREAVEAKAKEVDHLAFSLGGQGNGGGASALLSSIASELRALAPTAPAEAPGERVKPDLSEFDCETCGGPCRDESDDESPVGPLARDTPEGLDALRELGWTPPTPPAPAVVREAGGEAQGGAEDDADALNRDPSDAEATAAYMDLGKAIDDLYALRQRLLKDLRGLSRALRAPARAAPSEHTAGEGAALIAANEQETAAIWRDNVGTHAVRLQQRVTDAWAETARILARALDARPAVVREAGELPQWERDFLERQAQEDWTIGPDGRSNTSWLFLKLANEVARLIRDDAFQLIRGNVDRTAGLIMAQLAHKYGLAPQSARTAPDEHLQALRGFRVDVATELGWSDGESDETLLNALRSARADLANAQHTEHALRLQVASLEGVLTQVSNDHRALRAGVKVLHDDMEHALNQFDVGFVSVFYLHREAQPFLSRLREMRNRRAAVAKPGTEEAGNGE